MHAGGAGELTSGFLESACVAARRRSDRQVAGQRQGNAEPGHIAGGTQRDIPAVQRRDTACNVDAIALPGHLLHAQSHGRFCKLGVCAPDSRVSAPYPLH